MLNSFFGKIVAVLTSFFLAVAAFFGLGEAMNELDADTAPEIKNVIYLIGDGMGFNHIEKTELERNAVLFPEFFSIQGSSRTRSLSNSVTDSAAGGTALATGVRTGNGMIGVYYDDENALISYPKNIIELCMEDGMMTGIITTDSVTGATPAAFSAHTSSRENTEEIANDQLTSDIDLIWGKAVSVITESEVTENGYTYIATYDEMMALSEGSKSFGLFTNSLWKTRQVNKSTPNLEQMAVKAVDILDDTDEGFFLMIEAAHIDKHSHNQEGDKMTEALLEFSRTIEAMLDYAQKDGETLVVVTADHETGGITLTDGVYAYKNGSHSGVDVPLFVLGSEDIIADGETVDNYEIPIRIAYALGFTEEQFPVSVDK